MIRTHGENKVYIARYGKIHGPYSLVQLKRFLNEGTLDHSDLAWTHGMGKDWIELEHIISKFPTMNKPIEEDVIEQIEKIFILLENEEFDFAHDLISGLKSAQLYETQVEKMRDNLVDAAGDRIISKYKGSKADDISRKTTDFIMQAPENIKYNLVEIDYIDVGKGKETNFVPDLNNVQQGQIFYDATMGQWKKRISVGNGKLDFITLDPSIKETWSVIACFPLTYTISWLKLQIMLVLF